MPILNPDLTEVGPIEPGTYQATILSVGVQPSKKGDTMIVPEFGVQVGDQQRKRKCFLLISGAGAIGFGQLLRACHLDQLADAYADKNNTSKPPFDTDQLIGQTLQVVIDTEIRQDAGHVGETSDRIKTFLRN